DRLSDWTDQFALAVTYCQLRGGRVPFPEPPPGAPENRGRTAPDVTMLPEKEQPIVARALSAVPQARWPTCREMMAELTKGVKPERPPRLPRETHHGLPE